MASSGESFQPPMRRSSAFIEETVSTHAAQELSHIDLLQQLERIVNSKYFRNSKRYPVLLRFVVEQTLAGRSDLLKERTLGMTVFDRDSDYDTNVDPIVRVTAGCAGSDASISVTVVVGRWAMIPIVGATGRGRSLISALSAITSTRVP